MSRAASPLRPVLFSLALAAFVPAAYAVFSGYDAILGRIPKSDTAAALPAGSAAAFYRDRDALLADLPKLSPADAATRWLALAESHSRVRRQDWWLDNDRDYSDRSFDALLKALPGPDSWDAIVAGILARKPEKAGDRLALRTLAAALSGDKAQRAAVYGDTQKWAADFAKKNPRYTGNQNQVLTLLAVPGTPEAIAARKAAWDDAVASLAREGNSFGNSGPYLGSDIPDLVKLFGETKAREDLKKILVAGAQVNGNGGKGERTRALIREVSLTTVPEQKHPAWWTVTEDADPALFEALIKKFPESEANDYRREQAAGTHLGALVRAGRTDEAAVAAVAAFRKNGRIPQVGGWHSAKKIPAGAMADFFLKMLSAEPSIPAYQAYIRAAAAAGRSDEALKFIHATASRKDLSPEAKRALDDYETDALLAADKPDEAIPRLLAALAEKLPAKPAIDDNSPEGRKAREAYFRLESGRGERVRRVLALGKVLKRPDLTDAGLAVTRTALEALSKENSHEADALFGQLLEAGLYDEVERRAGEMLVACGAPAVSDGNSRGDSRAQSALVALFAAYHKAGRPADAIAVLEKSPHWPDADLRTLSESLWSGEASRLVVDTAADLAALGRNDEAKRLADYAVTNRPGDDAAYALLLKLLGPGDVFIARMDAQFAKDRFEERPLIWKAKALYELGKYDAALAAAKAAVAIDPSDGEQGKGDRLRAYAVLADILDKKGDAATAGVYRGAVSAIRIGEDADDIYAAGMLSRALAKWEESLTKFADAYCVQSRLAVRYAESGDMARAESHYTRAFELMPDSFGRIESHCFGCEGAFEGEVAQSIAERVFAGVVAKNPTNSRARYLIGYLREAQGRPADAAEAYRKAVELDPDYFNAWSKLAGLNESADLSPEEMARCAMAMFRLDPAGNHGGGASVAANIDDLKFVARTLAAAGLGASEDKTPLFPLVAAKARLDKAPKANRGGYYYHGFGPRRTTLTEVLSQHPLVRAASSLSQAGE